MLILYIIIFIITYALFSLSGFLFPIDKKWYNQLRKPRITPSGQVIGLVWAVLYGLISLALVFIIREMPVSDWPIYYILLWVLNYLSNQAFSFFLFKQKNLGAAAIDTAIVAVTALLLVIFTWPVSVIAAILLIPYVLWTSFATWLAIRLYMLNK